MIFCLRGSDFALTKGGDACIFIFGKQIHSALKMMITDIRGAYGYRRDEIYGVHKDG